MNQVWGHFKTITKHRHQVIRHAKKAGILWQGLFHDLSKYSPEEFLIGVKYYTDGTQSPNEGERRDFGYSKAWMHHKGRNKHHFEYWTDYNPKTKMLEPVPMPRRYLIEMFCDRVAASKIYQKERYDNSHPIRYYKNSMAEKMLHPQTAQKLELLLTMLSQKGEEETFRYIREELK